MARVVTNVEPSQRPPRPLWRNLDYMLLWSGQTVSSTGTQVSQLAFPLLILALTHSPASAGFAAALRALPYLIFSLPAGALIDRWDRKRTMILCDIGRAISMASIPLGLAFGQLSILQIYTVSLIEGTLFVFFNIAEVACLPRVVNREQLSAANAQNQATEGVTTLVGPSLGGVLYAVGSAIPFLADAISYAISFCSLFFIKAKFQKERGAVQRALRIEIWEGLTWLWQQRLIRFIAILTGGWNLISAGFTLIIIVIAQAQHTSSFVIGLIFAAGGIGAILGSLSATFFQRRFSFAQIIIGTTCFATVLIPLFAVAPNALVLGVLLALSFITGPIYNVVQMTYRMSLIPDELQGRVNSMFRLIAFGGQPLGAALTGILLQRAGVVVTILLCTAVMVFFSIATILNTHVRNARHITEMQND